MDTNKLHKKKLLIVDDSKEIRTGLVRLITPIKNIEIVGEAANGENALAMIAELTPDFVTLDIKMPGISGILVLLEIKKRSPNTTVFMLTNFPLEHYKTVCQNAGANYFFDKSNEFEEMVNTIRALAEDSHINRN